MKRPRKKFKQPPLQPLRIPTGWKVEWNTFFEVEPKFKSYDQISWNFGEDMLLVENKRVGIVIELGWYPGHRWPGEFKLVALRLERVRKLMGMAWENPERKLWTRSKEKVVRTLERWMEWYGNQKMRAASKRKPRRRKKN